MPHASVTINHDNVLGAAAGLYWFASMYHGGQNSPLYSILSRSMYRPGYNESGPDESANEFYLLLEDGALDPVELNRAIEEVWNA